VPPPWSSGAPDIPGAREQEKEEKEEEESPIKSPFYRAKNRWYRIIVRQVD